MKTIRSMVTVFLFSLLFTAPVHAAVSWNFVGGELIGAQGVVVNGNDYDVSFTDGTCVNVFGGCNELSDFAFTTLADATAAALALLGQVHIDDGGSPGLLDTDPELTNDCEDDYICQMVIPYNLGPGLFVSAVSAVNISPINFPLEDDFLFFTTQLANSSGLGAPSVTFAVFTPSPIPLPAAGWLFGTALLSLAGIRRSR